MDEIKITDLNNKPFTTVQRDNIYAENKAEPNNIKLLMKDVADIRANGLRHLEENTIDYIEVHYVVEYLTAVERINFVNEAYKILKNGCKITIHSSHWAANKTYGNIADIQWPPVVEAWYPNLNRKHREEQNIIETRYTCDFDVTWGYGMHPLIVPRNSEYQQHALIFWKEAPQDLIATLIKR